MPVAAGGLSGGLLAGYHVLIEGKPMYLPVGTDWHIRSSMPTEAEEQAMLKHSPRFASGEAVLFKTAAGWEEAHVLGVNTNHAAYRLAIDSTGQVLYAAADTPLYVLPRVSTEEAPEELCDPSPAEPAQPAEPEAAGVSAN